MQAKPVLVHEQSVICWQQRYCVEIPVLQEHVAEEFTEGKAIVIYYIADVFHVFFFFLRTRGKRVLSL